MHQPPSPPEPDRSSDPATAERLQRRLRRLEGQLRGLAGMVEADRDCVELLTQVLAIRRAIAGSADALLEACLERRLGENELDPHELAALVKLTRG